MKIISFPPKSSIYVSQSYWLGARKLRQVWSRNQWKPKSIPSYKQKWLPLTSRTFWKMPFLCTAKIWTYRKLPHRQFFKFLIIICTWHLIHPVVTPASLGRWHCPWKRSLGRVAVMWENWTQQIKAFSSPGNENLGVVFLQHVKLNVHKSHYGSIYWIGQEMKADTQTNTKFPPLLVFSAYWKRGLFPPVVCVVITMWKLLWGWLPNKYFLWNDFQANYCRWNSVTK